MCEGELLDDAVLKAEIKEAFNAPEEVLIYEEGAEDKYFVTCGREWYDLSKNIWIPFVYDAKTNTITEMNVMTDDYLQYLDLL